MDKLQGNIHEVLKNLLNHHVKLMAKYSLKTIEGSIIEVNEDNVVIESTNIVNQIKMIDGHPVQQCGPKTYVDIIIINNIEWISL